jgi:hypothetical protein
MRSFVVSRWPLVVGKFSIVVPRCERPTAIDKRRPSTRTTSKPLESPHAAPDCGSTSGKCRTCAEMRADVRRTCSGCVCAWRTWVSSRFPASDAARRRLSLVLLLSPNLAPDFVAPASRRLSRERLAHEKFYCAKLLTLETACPDASTKCAPGCRSPPWSQS